MTIEASDLISAGYTLWLVFIMGLVINMWVVPLVHKLRRRDR